MVREEDRVHEIMRQIAAGNDVGNKLVYDEQTKTIRPASGYHDPDKAIEVTPKDMEHFSSRVRGAT